MLDTKTQALIWQVVLHYARTYNVGLLVISHESALLKRLCDRIIDLTHPPLAEMAISNTLSISLCKLLQYRKEGCNAPLFPVLKQLAHCYTRIYFRPLLNGAMKWGVEHAFHTSFHSSIQQHPLSLGRSKCFNHPFACHSCAR